MRSFHFSEICGEYGGGRRPPLQSRYKANAHSGGVCGGIQRKIRELEDALGDG
jgi:hypothetical protein